MVNICIGKDQVAGRQRRDHLAENRIGAKVLRERQVVDVRQEILFIHVVSFLQAA